MSNVNLNNYTNYVNRLSITKELLEVEKGSPKKITEESDLFYWYGSVVAHKAEIYRIQNNQIVWIAIDLTNDKLSVEDFVELWGEPEYSVKRYEGVDSFQNKVLAWPSKGRALLINGNNIYSRAVRMEFFQPETVDQYLTNWGNKYADKDRVNLLVTPTVHPQTSISSEPLQTLESTKASKGVEVGGIVLVILVVLSILSILWKRKRILKNH